MTDIKSLLGARGMLTGLEQSLLLSAVILAHSNSSFEVSLLKGEGSPTDGEIIYGQIDNPSDKISFIRSRASLNEKSPETGKTLIREVSENYTQGCLNLDILSELYGGAYDYSGRDGHELGIVLTPPHICELCCELLNLKAGDVLLEPCCGTGRFLATALKYVGDSVYGIEYQDDLHEISRANLVLNGARQSEVICGDFFKEDFMGKKFTAGYMNPPYSQKLTELQYIERLLRVLEVGARAAVVVPVSVMIGKTRADKQVKAEILKFNTLEGVINLNKDTFYGVGTVPCIAIFRAGKPHPPKYKAKFVNFEDDGYEVKKHVGLVATERAAERKKYLLECWRGERTDYRTAFMVKGTVEWSDEWLHSFYYYNDETPTEENFASSITDYLTFEANMIFHGRSYLFKGGEKNE